MIISNRQSIIGLNQQFRLTTRMPKYVIVEEAARHCWGKNFMEVFRDFFARHAAAFLDAPATISGEQNLEYYSLFQQYLKLYENTLQDYIESLDVSIEAFYAELGEIKDDTSIKDKKLLHFVNYLLACTDYDSFYKVMVRAAKKELKAESKTSDSRGGEGKDNGGDSDDEDRGESKGEGKSSRK